MSPEPCPYHRAKLTRFGLTTCSLHALSRRLVEADTIIPAPPPASERIHQRPFDTMLKHQWNIQVEALFHAVGDWDRRVVDWGRRVLYGGDASPSDGARAR